MTEKDKMEIAQEVVKLLQKQTYQVRTQPKEVLLQTRKKWVCGPDGNVGRESKLGKAFDNVTYVHEVWDKIRRLICWTFEARTVYDILDSQTANELGDALCQLLYDYRMKVKEMNKL